MLNKPEKKRMKYAKADSLAITETNPDTNTPTINNYDTYSLPQSHSPI